MNYRDFKSWNIERLWELRKEICLGSMYYDDYENSFGVPKDICHDFFDGFIEMCFLMENEFENGLTKLEDIYDKYDNANDLWNYFYNIEYPFGY